MVVQGDEYTKYVALGLINVVNVLQPEAIAIGGKYRKIVFLTFF